MNNAWLNNPVEAYEEELQKLNKREVGLMGSLLKIRKALSWINESDPCMHTEDMAEEAREEAVVSKRIIERQKTVIQKLSEDLERETKRADNPSKTCDSYEEASEATSRDTEYLQKLKDVFDRSLRTVARDGEGQPCIAIKFDSIRDRGIFLSILNS